MRAAIVSLILCVAVIAAAEDFPANWHARGVLISAQRIDTLKTRVQQKTEPNYSAWLKLKQEADNELARAPHVPEEWYVPGFYVNAEAHKMARTVLQDDGNAAYKMALAYRITGEEKYAVPAVRLINAWATRIKKFSQKDDSTLSFSYHFPALIFAADLLRAAPCWPAAEQEQFRSFLRESALPMSSIRQGNNWGNWGLLLSISIAAYLDDEKLFKACVSRWKSFIDSQVGEDGYLIHEVTRNGGRSGVWYSNFSLMPQTLAAEVARVNGVDLFEFCSPNGKTLSQIFRKLAPWCNHPETFPYYKGDAKDLHGATYVSYFELLNERWPNADAKALLDKYRPMSAVHSAPALTFTHGGLLNDK